MGKKLVSILVPVYNRENLIEETVNSGLSQTYENIEIIIVDNQSTDGTWKILEKLASQDKRIKIFQNNTNIGPVRNWKRCIDEASGEYGKILWSDDLIAPEFLERTVLFLNNKDVGFVFTGTEIFIDGTDKKSSHYFIGETGIYDSKIYIDGVLFNGQYPVSPGCSLFRLKDLKKNLLVDVPNKVGSDFSMHAIGNDLLIYLLAANQYKNFAFVNDELSFFRAHNGSITVQSNDGKLPLHYNLASSYFVENYRRDLINKMNVNLFIGIRKYQDTAKKFKLNQIECYYMNNNNFSIDYYYLLTKVFKKILFKVVYFISKKKMQLF
jgi:glycosyltransferase involved in cell wall biosynthesis